MKKSNRNEFLMIFVISLRTIDEVSQREKKCHGKTGKYDFGQGIKKFFVNKTGYVSEQRQT